jgi:nuclear pore complex protein Nup107
MLPTDLSAITNPEERATEYLQYRQFFNIWELLDRVVECQSLEVSQVMSKETKKAWLDDYQVCIVAIFLVCVIFELLLVDWCWQSLVEQAREQIIKLLTSEWLVSDVENPAGQHFSLLPQWMGLMMCNVGDNRRRELIRIRQIYIPELIIRLHAMLFISRHHIPG